MVQPIEDVDKEFAEQLRAIVERRTKALVVDTRVFDMSSQNPQEVFLDEERNIGRNDPCLCGSNKKYKKCCGG